ncbi:lactate utilization protein C [Helicobacter cholecystus]|uniref:Lactate utilization protein C n=1 Tax=Helicobacter cholecystus TaxID=45498 RepID=A0A3D8ISF6_9HELI|nr:lactate utilization protein C [Helicobacter cholecystus]RDU68218.1 lactate utilization protein C [Helicobacter cholecystus]VEJ24487.1 Uncharacterised ACR, YkgG family COG1556 [Helicobacter cholecystus]
MSKERILHKVQDALKKNPIQHESGSYRDIIIPIEQERITEYIRAQRANKAEVIESEESQILKVIEEILQKEKIESILVPTSLAYLELSVQKINYDKSIEEMKDKLFNIDCSILQADFGVSNLGIVSVISSPTQARLLSLITRCNIILLKKEKILGNMSEVLQTIKAQHPNILPSNILFIAGPSRTADIELQVVFGVHGPQSVYIVLY